MKLEKEVEMTDQEHFYLLKANLSSRQKDDDNIIMR